MDSENKDQILYAFDEVVTLAELERKHIATALHRLGGNKTQAAKVLGVSLKTLYNKLNEYAKLDAEANKQD
jgi:DNA-binding NtrC family response regulator